MGAANQAQPVCPDLAEARAQLPAVLRLLTQISLESMANLVPENTNADALMEQHFQRMSAMCTQIQLDAKYMNPRWNKIYGEGGTHWQGGLNDGRNRGDVPYFCPSGWTRFALKVCADDEFENRFEGWGYLYHGTKGRFVGSILTSGFRASKGLCFCGKEDHAVYMSPSVEYCAHPRYGCIEYNPETRHWLQIVLQCRVNPEAVWKICPETLFCKEFGLRVDPNVENDKMEWLFKPNYTNPETGDKFITDAIVCTGIMMRATQQHPLDLHNWWSNNVAYEEKWQMRQLKVDPFQDATLPTIKATWKTYEDTKIVQCTFTGEPTGSVFDLQTSRKNMGTTWISPVPFGNGSMRFAWFLHTSVGLYVVKKYNQESERHIKNGLGITQVDAIAKDVATYLVAQHYAGLFNNIVVDEEWHVDFVKPVIVELAGEHWFGERYVKGGFLKWNTNTGETNLSEDAKINHMDKVASAFSHFTFSASKGNLMVVDIQGWDTGKHATFTDPQIHTRAFSGGSADRRNDVLYKRFSVGNLGRTGMLRFFANHECNQACKFLKLAHPFCPLAPPM